MKTKLNKVEISNNVEQYTWQKDFFCQKIKKKPLLYKIIKWLFSKKPEIKKMFLIDFINETNGATIIEIVHENHEGITTTLSAKGLIIKDLTLQKVNV